MGIPTLRKTSPLFLAGPLALVALCLCVALAGCAAASDRGFDGAQDDPSGRVADEEVSPVVEEVLDGSPGPSDEPNIGSGELKDTVFSLVFSAENSTTDYQSQYGYIEDIGDGRGYTAGLIGFTSATGDLLEVVKRYVFAKGSGTALEAYIPALEAVDGAGSHEGLGEGFVRAWKEAGTDPAMIEAQNEVIDDFYLAPAIEAAEEDGLGPLGQYIYYDALVVHGPGDDEDSFGGIRAAAKARAKTPAAGGDEKAYLEAFLKARKAVMLKEEAHSDLSRINVQQRFLDEGNYQLVRPLRWTMYGDELSLS